MGRLLGIVSVCVLLGCSSGDTSRSLFVELRTDFIAGVEFAGIEVELFPSVPTTASQPVARQEAYAVFGMAGSPRVAEFALASEGTWALRTRLREASGDILLEQITLVDLAANTTAIISMVRACEGVVCPAAGDSASALACLGGRCVDPRCQLNNLDACGTPECNMPSDCSPVAACAEVSCEFGVCVAVATNLSCGADEYCQPELGCTALECAFDGSVGSPCSSDMDCDDRCIEATCALPSGPGGPCDAGQDGDCESGHLCTASVCLGDTGASCGADTECIETCIGGSCGPLAGPGSACDSPADCVASFACIDSLCSVPVPVFSTAAFHEVPSSTDSAQSVSLGDLNGDGNADVVTTNPSDNSVSVLLGVGDGSLLSSTEFGACTSPYWTEIADFDEDGALDVAVLCRTAVVILRGVGDGSLEPAVTIAGALGSTSSATITARDVNRDDDLDLVTTDYIGDQIQVLLGNGDGTFGPTTPISTGDGPDNLDVGDLDGDGILDLAVVFYSGFEIRSLIGVGDGTFLPGVTIATSERPQVVQVADVNNDGDADLLVGLNSEMLEVYVGNGDGSFQTVQRFPGVARPADMKAVDINGDGHIDIVTAPGDAGPQGTHTAGGVTVEVLLGAGDGSFSERATLYSASDIEAVALADMTGDGVLDVVAAAFRGVALHPGNGDGSFQGISTGFDTADEPASVAADDLDGDGVLDLAVVSTEAQSVTVHLGVGNGSFGPGADYTVVPLPQFALLGAIILEDLNEDGISDALVPNSFPSRQVMVLPGTGAGGFGTASGYEVATTSSISGFSAGDVNQDGHVDAVVSVRAMRTVNVMLGAGDGTLGVPIPTTLSNETGSHALGDVNEDGVVDVLVATFSAFVDVLLGQGDGTFAVADRVLVTASTASVVVQDLDGDGHLDLIASGGTQTSISLGAGDGTFSRLTQFSTIGSTLRVSDVNNDGRADIISGATATFRMGYGNGFFGPPNIQTFPMRSPILEDFNRDGLRDLLSLDAKSDSIIIAPQRP